MITNKKNPEILAPAGSMDSVRAAVFCHADAVYLGGKDFSARQNATNFDYDELKDAITFCHSYGVKVYVAVNTMVFDNQINQLCNYIAQCAELHADALIVQDLAVASLARQTAPDLPLHASTQMTLHTPMGAEFAKKCGFTRAVVAREMNRNQLEKMCRCGIEIEAFIHGALCMSVSGQCYMSAFIGSRSANRGLCAQACRLPFSSIGNQQNAALSLKDLSLVERLYEICDIGIDSIKIEGRMKRPEYVAAAVTACYNALNGLPVDMDVLHSVFSRSGFTDSYFTSEKKNMFGMRSREDVVSAESALPKLRTLYEKTPKIGDISFKLELKENAPAMLYANDSFGFDTVIQGDIAEKAINRAADYEFAKKQLSKLGQTVYNFKELQFVSDGIPAVSAASLNDMRRKAVDELTQKRINANSPVYKLHTTEIMPLTYKKKHSGVPLLRLRISDISQLNDDADVLIVPLNIAEKNADILINTGKEIIIEPPRYINDETDITARLKALKDMGFTHLLCQNYAYIEIGKSLDFVLHGGFGLNIANSLALKLISEHGVCDAILSPELKFNQISKISSPMPTGIIAYGHFPLMLTANCPIKNERGTCSNCPHELCDRTDRTFEVKCSPYGYTEIFNSMPIWLADKAIDYKDSVDFIDIFITSESKDEVDSIVNAYKNKCSSSKDFTRGLYYRGIL